MKYFAMLVILCGVSFATMGCEAHGKVEDDDNDHHAKVKIDAD